MTIVLRSIKAPDPEISERTTASQLQVAFKLSVSSMMKGEVNLT
jgi:hypothetical protein